MMNAICHRHSGDDPAPDREPATDRQHATIGFDARDRLRGTLDDTTVRQAVLGVPQSTDSHPQQSRPESEC
ncbi:MAG: hypothetical protein J07HN4v3_00493 [Halonotius sp. J07HN4]|nr:MAG: hypothetical protein J07HN4v3_00493 [Halonotius sp. J07HN4]